ncbi:FHF complex subunit HOOK-interacting protein 1B-like isoform X2 [Mytilus galloprovincialis]|uniref:FHF complex subunit HOOK-interacting protein 1B-like isoform X2 n=1 Tax=Mytilus galloprovincialis TaxID=29158 RepID=UPI003F7B9FCD
MSWFKRGRNDSKLSSKSGSSDSLLDGRPRSETDPQTCLEVFKNHWSQAVGIINKGQIQDKGQQAIDEVDTVFQNFEQMLTLLENEEGLDDNGQGMPGPILHYLLENQIFEKVSVWCQSQTEQTDKIILEQLRLYEQLISQSHQILLIHKAVIQPLLRLLSFCEETQNSAEIEVRLVLVLHQICVCISQQTLILESFFNTNANHGPARFLIFSLLIPFIHRERRIGQQARDALLLIMSLSSKHPHIGQYIAEHSDFCPVLATGLSGLYSSLPRKLPNTSEDWSCITQKDITATPELQMFLNSLEFCNAVVQISDPQVRCQLIQYIYDGFLVPVLGPALHQNSREEVIAATAYLELFLRKITEPALTRAFIRFILTEQNDEIIILDSLTTRINSSSRLLCSASLSLFKTLVDLNCEDVMFEIIFKHLIPCSHVMVSQRRAVKDLDLYSKSSERFLSLRPSCLVTGSQDIHKIPDIDVDRSNNLKITVNRPKRGLGSFLLARKQELEHQKVRSRSNSFENSKSNFTTNSIGGKLEQYDSNYIDYLSEAKLLLENCSKACTVWTYPYNGDIPPHEVFQEIMSPECSKKWLSDSDISTVISEQTANLKTCDTSFSDINSLHTENSQVSSGNEDSKASTNLSGADEVFASDSSVAYSTIPEVSDVLWNIDWTSLDDPNSPVEDVSEFIDYLKEVGTPPEEDPSIQTSIQSLSSVFSSLRSLSSSRTSTPCTSKCNFSKTDDISVSSSLSLEKSSETVLNSDQELKSTSDPKVKFEGGDATTFEVIDSVNQAESSHNKSQDSETGSESWSAENKSENKSNQQNDTSYIEITMSSLPHGKSLPNDMATLHNGTTSPCSDASTDGSTKRSVSFSLPTTSMQSSVSKVPSGAGLSNTPGIGPFLTALLTKLEGMIQNPFAVNFLLTGIISRLAAFPQPLLRSFLLSHNLVFQPTVKSLLQVIASVRQKVDHCSYTIPNFEQLLLKARMTLIVREENWRHGIDPNQIQNNAVTVSAPPPPEPVVKEKRKLSLTDLLFRRTPNSQRKTSNYKAGKGAPQLQIIPGGKGYRYVNQRQQNIPDNPMDSPKTRHSVYCAVILDEFVKELAAICQEHAVLILDEGYYSN